MQISSYIIDDFYSDVDFMDGFRNVLVLGPG